MNEKYRLRVFEKRVLRKISGPKKDKVTREWRRLYIYITRSFTLCTPHQTIFV
jgi:hypothetical protein